MTVSAPKDIKIFEKSIGHLQKFGYSRVFEIGDCADNKEKLTEWLVDNFLGDFVLFDCGIKPIVSSINKNTRLHEADEEAWSRISYYLYCHEVDATAFKLAFG